MTILFVGAEEWEGTENAEMQMLVDEAESRGVETAVEFIDDLAATKLTARVGDGTFVFGDEYEYDAVSGVVYLPGPSTDPLSKEHRDQLNASPSRVIRRLRENEAFVTGAMSMLSRHGVRCIPDYQNTTNKWVMLEDFENAGLRVPETLITTDPVEAGEFVEEKQEVVVKPLGSAPVNPKVFTPEQLTEGKLEGIESAPIQLQPFIDGDDVRCYVVDGEFIGAVRISSSEVSYKDDVAAGRTPTIQSYEPPADVRRMAVEAVSVAGSNYGAVDILDADRPTLLEVNGMGRFAFVEEHGVRVTEAIIDYLCEPDEGTQ